MRKANRSSSKGAARDPSLEKTAKRYDGSDDAAIPSWAKALKKKL